MARVVKNPYVTAIIVVVAVVSSSTGVYAFHQMSTVQHSYPPASLPVSAGTVIAINSTYREMVGGGAITPSTHRFYGLTYNLSLSGNYTLTGQWKSTGKSLVYLYFDGRPYMETPTPEKTHGLLNQTLWPGDYTFVIAGYRGDLITITSAIVLQHYTPHAVSVFTLANGTEISSPQSYSFSLSEPGIMLGALSVGGQYSYGLHGTGGGFSTTSYNASSPNGTAVFNLGDAVQLSPGNYTLSFSTGKFYVNHTIRFVLYYNNSTA